MLEKVTFATLVAETHGDDKPECPTCGGEGQLLGQLGHRIHFRCRACGMDFSMRFTIEARS